MQRKIPHALTAIMLSVCIGSVLLLASGCATVDFAPSQKIATVPADALYKNPVYSAAERAKDLLNRMTLEEKIGQITQADRQFLSSETDIADFYLGSILSGGGSAPEQNDPEGWADMYDEFQKAALSTRLGIPIIYGIDAVHGHNNVKGATIFPHNIGLGAAGDAELVEKIARATAVEMAATGIDWNFAPCLAVPLDVRWGRTYEGFSQNPELVSRLGAAAVRGYQGANLSDKASVLATVKHFVADGGTTGGVDRGDAKVDEAFLRSVHMMPYLASLGAGAGSAMPSYSSWNDVKMHGNKKLLVDVLRGELGFDGFIVSDWAAFSELPGDYEDQVTLCINSGVDMIMVPDDFPKFIEVVTEQVAAGAITEGRIDEAVTKILEKKFELGLFEKPFADRDLLDRVGGGSHRALAREAVQKSLVVLKNESVLPLDASKLKHVLIAGSFADNLGAQCGGWTITWQGENGDSTEGTTVLEAFRAALPADVKIYTTLTEAEGVLLDTAILVIGERPYAEGRGDSKSLALAFAHEELVQKVSATGVPVATVLFSGRPMLAENVIAASDAFVAAWLPGTEGAGIVDVLLGKVKPTGRLSMQWPRTLSQVPYAHGVVGEPSSDPSLLASTDPLPIGYGLTW